MGRSCRGLALTGKLLLAVVIIVGLASAGWAGQAAPNFTLKDVMEGKEYSLGQFKGKVVLVNFFTFFCAPCREEMPHLSKLNQELQAKGYQTLGIGLASSSEQLQTLTKQLGLSYPVLMGNNEVSQSYGNIQLVPTTFIIDRQGKIAHKILGARTEADLLKMIKPLL